MLRREDWMDIQARVEEGTYLKDIAAELGVHPRTIRRALQRGGPPSGKRPKRATKLDPYKAEIDRLLAAGVWNTVVILREIQQRGYAGGASRLRDYVRPKRPLRAQRATVRFETAPGKQLQNDWGEVSTVIGGEQRKVFFSVSTLGFSRRFHFWGSDSQDAEHTYEGLIRAFEHFGGAPAEVLVDNQKAAVIRHRIGEAVEFHPGFLDLAAHYGFRPRACRPYRARTKGKDERMVGYIKHHFFVRYREFEDLGHLNRQAEQWLAEEADQRRHGTVHEVVAQRFAREAPALQVLPAVRFDTSYRELRYVAWDAYVEVRGNRYSVSDALCGQAVSVRISLDGVLSIYDMQDQKVCEHRLQPASEGWSTLPDHHARLWRNALVVERRDLGVYEEVAQWSR
jgi:transposase